jgi:hypothetical protein
MNIKLWYNLRMLRKTSKPRSSFKRELNSKLSDKFDEIYGEQTFFQKIIWARTTRVLLASSLSLSMVGTSAYAYNSPQVTEGSILYPVKIGIEKVEEQTKVTTVAKVKFLIKQAERRDAEREVLVKKFNTQVSKPAVVQASVTSTTDVVSSSEEIILNPESTSTTSTVEKSLDHEEKSSERNDSFKEIKKAIRKSRKDQSQVENDIKIRETKDKISNDVIKTEQKIENVEQKLNEVKSVLKDDDEGKELRKIIEEHIERSHNREREQHLEFERNRENDEINKGESSSGHDENRDGESHSGEQTSDSSNRDN